ncbi:Predicted DNA-binding transcriptional regulator YafY, contains an HTH and WYL domains [Gracilibacillus orientalis]|uniref:Predicted DNA-binding transcriptional regulator YafY, contains an HTH and WYL domains n=1 Tax=Gracilibacillus orientalis TaxID=334253 RepID=A0A1I4LLB1_9BACI|nr:YafY family protein [Gracilibacillus orientalis]SFL91367.1 Predicted DNA-binding transcriptional regulator YafY, contains an HTH and WYL domains [Gracilibacillus orientalis]
MKIDRLLGIIMLLIHRKRMKAVELSRYFEVSERTIYRDMESLNSAGIPILSLPGQEGGYELMDGFLLDKKYLTLDELLSIQWALSSIEKATGFEDINELITKINQLIDPETTQDKNIQLHLSDSNHIQTIYKAIQNCKVIGIRYVNYTGTETKRSIEPMGIFLSDYHWYTWAYCLLRNEPRVFKLTRIVETYNTNRYFIRRPYTIEDIYENSDKKSGSDIRPFTVCLRFSQEARAQVLDNFREDEIVDSLDGTITVEKNYYSNDRAISQIMSFGNKVRIVYPKELIPKFIKCLNDIKKLYKDSEEV